MPRSNQYGPLNENFDENDIVIMTVDEYETVRLIDLENFTQEECSAKMNIARTTVQGIYINARKKIADSLVNCKKLLIQGGEYELCKEDEYCGMRGCFRHRHGHGNK